MQLQAKQHHLIELCKTHWNSACEVLERLSEKKLTYNNGAVRSLSYENI